MKKFICAFVALALCINPALASYAVEAGYLGDANMDNSIDAVDASLILSQYAATSTGKASLMDEAQMEYANTNLDDAVDSSDASLVLAYYAYIATGGTISPEEFYVNPPAKLLPTPKEEPNMPEHTGRYQGLSTGEYKYCWNDIVKKAYKKDSDGNWVEFDFFDYDAFLYAREQEESGGGTIFGPCVGYGYYMGRDGRAMFIPSWDPELDEYGNVDYYGVMYYDEDLGCYYSGLLFGDYIPWT